MEPDTDVAMLINATGHVIRQRLPDGSLKEYRATPLVVRLPGEDIRDPTIKGVDVVQRQFSVGSTMLPSPMPGVLYIVSRKVAYAYDGVRDDLVYPDTEDGAERDELRRVTAVYRFRRPDKGVA